VTLKRRQPPRPPPIVEVRKRPAAAPAAPAPPHWNSDPTDFAKAIAELEAALPGFAWVVGQCGIGAHASCSLGYSTESVRGGHPLDRGFHCDTQGGTPAEALRDVMWQAVKYLRRHGRRLPEVVWREPAGERRATRDLPPLRAWGHPVALNAAKAKQ